MASVVPDSFLLRSLTARTAWSWTARYLVPDRMPIVDRMLICGPDPLAYCGP